MARELAVGARRRDVDESLEEVVATVDLREATEDEVVTFFEPILLTGSIVDNREDALVPTEEILLELDRALLAAVPATEPTREAGPESKLLRLVRVLPLLRMLLRLVVLKDGNGDLEREDDAIDPFPPAAALSSFPLLTRMEGGLLPLAKAAVGRAGAAADFFPSISEGGPIFFAGSDLAGIGFGRLLGAASAGLPRFHTLWTRVLAEDKNPNREGFGFGFSRYSTTRKW